MVNIQLYARVNYLGVTEDIYLANRNFANSRMYSGHVMPVLLDVSIPIGATGAVGTIKGPYIKAVTRLAAGTYQIQMQDNYNGYYVGGAQLISPVSGSAVDPHGVTVGTSVQITTLGNTNWSVAGVPAGVTPAVGLSFVLAAQPAVGTGRVKAIGSSGIMACELIGDPNFSIQNSNSANNSGAIAVIQCIAPQVGAAVTQGSALQFVAQDPANGSTLKVFLMLSNSSVLINGE